MWTMFQQELEDQEIVSESSQQTTKGQVIKTLWQISV